MKLNTRLVTTYHSELKKREASRQSIAAFTEYTKPDYEMSWHHRLLCDELDRFINGDIKRMMIFMPPQHGKSELVSRRLPAYALGRLPDTRIIATSYGADLASRMNRDVQRIIDDIKYKNVFPESALNTKNVRNDSTGSWVRNNDMFEIVGHRGSYRCAGVGGGITGMGFDIGIIDDPIKDDAEAGSATYRNSVWEWYATTFYTRRGKDAKILLTMTRWHEDDLAGRLLKLAASDPDADQWHVVKLRAIRDGASHINDPRKNGEALWATRYSVNDLNKSRKNSERKFVAMYQQEPRPMDGALFKLAWLQKTIEPRDLPVGLRWARYWDLAYSTKQSADNTATISGAIGNDGTIYLRRGWANRIETPDIRAKIAETCMNERADRHGVEKAIIGGGVVQDLRRMPELAAISIVGIDVDKDKLVRATPIADRAAAGKLVFVVEHETDYKWINEFVDELCAFPFGRHDDRVDAVSGVFGMIANNSNQCGINAEQDIMKISEW